VLNDTTRAHAGRTHAGRSLIIAEARRWIGTPYHHRASLRGVGTDCLGLIRGVWRALYDGEPEPLPDYTQDWAEATGAETLLEASTRHLLPVTGAPEPGDVILFRMRRNGPARHVGIMGGTMDAPTLIHALSPYHVTESAYAPSWRKRAAAAFAFPPVPEADNADD